jgi:hypothetical protein
MKMTLKQSWSLAEISPTPAFKQFTGKQSDPWVAKASDLSIEVTRINILAKGRDSAVQ